MKKICLYVLSVAIVTCLSSFAGISAFSASQDEPLTQTDEPSDFEDWYEPDDSYRNRNPDQTDQGKVAPEGGENEPRVAPDEDTRPKER